MKKLITLVLASILFITVSHAQDSTIEKSAIISDSGALKSTIYSNALQWVTSTWKSAKDVIQVKDEDGGLIVVKGGLTTTIKAMMGLPVPGQTITTVTIKVKDGKAKISFSDTQYNLDNGGIYKEGNGSKKSYQRWLDGVSGEEVLLIDSFKKALKVKDDF